jgi:hypothetical protein
MKQLKNTCAAASKPFAASRLIELRRAAPAPNAPPPEGGAPRRAGLAVFFIASGTAAPWCAQSASGLVVIVPQRGHGTAGGGPGAAAPSAGGLAANACAMKSFAAPLAGRTARLGLAPIAFCMKSLCSPPGALGRLRVAAAGLPAMASDLRLPETAAAKGAMVCTAPIGARSGGSAAGTSFGSSSANPAIGFGTRSMPSGGEPASCYGGQSRGCIWTLRHPHLLYGTGYSD